MQFRWQYITSFDSVMLGKVYYKYLVKSECVSGRVECIDIWFQSDTLMY